MTHDLFSGFSQLLTPEAIGLLIAGMALGMFMGMLPGLGVSLALSLLLPRPGRPRTAVRGRQPDPIHTS